MKKLLLILVAISAIMFSCKKEKKAEVDMPNKGEITIETDESFQSVTEALVERYMALYPNT